MVLVVAACASPPEQQIVDMAKPSAPPTADTPADAGGALPVVEGFMSSGDARFDAWRLDYVHHLVARGWSTAFLRQQLNGLTPDPAVVRSDRGQPEFSKPISDYLKGAVSSDRVSRGQTKLAGAAAWLPAIEAKSGTPSEILVAIWGMESAFGAVQGDRDVVRSLATLAADGRRRAMAEEHLTAALKMIRDGGVSRSQLRGSWAGAMGQTQFMPETFLSTEVDGDGDGRRDIWNSAPDALASAANLLKSQGNWQIGQSWAREVVLPQGFDYGLAEGVKQTPAAWQALGVRTADGGPFRPADLTAEAQLIVPMGWRGPAFLAFPNHFAIRKYNNSTSYALGIGLLADAIAGRPSLVAAWPDEPATRLADRRGAQAALNRLGFDVGEPDGVIGVKTRAAVRAYQAARGLIADGYLSSALMQRLIAEGASASAQALPPAAAPGA
jgi:membrane-bound lytic murein transglycosylase B